MDEPKTTKQAVKAEDNDYKYVFRGWDKGTVTANGTKKTYKPLFTAVPKTTYYVQWLNGDGSLLDSKSYKEGQKEPSTTKIPVKAPDESNTYEFDGWSSGTVVGKTKTYTPYFKAIAKQIYYVIFLNAEDIPTAVLTYTEGEKEPTPTEIPPKAEDSKFTYVFDKWERTVKGDEIRYRPLYKAVAKPEKTTPVKPEPEIKEYTVFWLNGDDTILECKKYNEKQRIPTTEKIPFKAEDANYTYVFKEWYEQRDGLTVTYSPVFYACQKPIPNPETSDATIIIPVALLVVSLAVALFLIFGKKNNKKDD